MSEDDLTDDERELLRRVRWQQETDPDYQAQMARLEQERAAERKAGLDRIQKAFDAIWLVPEDVAEPVEEPGESG